MLLETVGDAASATPQPRLPQHPFPAMQHCPLTARLLPKYNIYGGSQANLTSNPEVIPSVALASLGGGGGLCILFYMGVERCRDPATRIPHLLPRLKVVWVGLIPAPQPLITNMGGMKLKGEASHRRLACYNTLLPC